MLPCCGHVAGASSIADPSESLIFHSPSSSLGVSARFAPTVLPLTTALGDEGGAEGGYPEEGPEQQERGREEEVDAVTTAVDEEDTNAVVDTAEGQGEEGGLMGERAEAEGSLSGIVSEVDGVEGGGEGVMGWEGLYLSM